MDENNVPKLSSRLIGNSGWNALAFFINVTLNFLTLPFVIKCIGVPEFGFAGLIVACVAPMLIFSNTLSQVTTRELALRLLPNSQKRAKQVFATSFFLALVFGALIAFFLFLLGPWAAMQLFNLEVGGSSTKLSFAFASFGWLCQCLSGVFLTLFAARQNYNYLSKISIGSTLLSTMLIWFLLPSHPHAITYIACQSMGFVLNLALVFWFGYRIFPSWIALPKLHFESLHDLMRIGIWQMIAQFGGGAAVQTDKYMLGYFLQARHVGLYNLAQRLEEVVYIGVLKVGEVLFPLFSTMLKEQEERQADILFRASWLLNLLAVSVLGGLIPTAKTILKLWINYNVAIEAEHALITLALAGILGCSTNVFSFYLLGSGKTRTNAIISAITAIVTVITSILTLPLYGWHAAGWSVCAGAFAQIIVVAILMQRSFYLPRLTSRITHFVLMPIVIGAFVAFILKHGIGNVIEMNSNLWWQALCWYILNVGLIASAVMLVSRFGYYGLVCSSDVQRIFTRLIVIIKG